MNIEEVCKKYNIKNWSVVDGKVNVNGNVDLSYRNLTSLDIFDGIPFGEVSGSFFCYNNRLSSLKGAPTLVGDNFFCYNNQLTSLKGAPTSIGDNFFCYNNQLTSLKYAPSYVGRDFYCSNNQLTSLKGAPTKVGGSFNCNHNILISLEGAPTSVDVYFSCSNNQLKSLEYAPTNVNGNFYCGNNNILDFKYLLNIEGDLYLNTQLQYLYDNFIKTKDNIELFNEFNIIRGKVINIKRLNTFIQYYGGNNTDTDKLEELGYKLS